MHNFIRKEIDGNKLELLVDTNFFSKDVLMKTSYLFIDRWTFFFLEENWKYILQFEAKDDLNIDLEEIYKEFSNELLTTYLRDKVEKENQEIRQIIFREAFTSSIDPKNYIEKEIDFKDDDINNEIDDLIAEVENDPELEINEEEIRRMIEEVKNQNNEELDDTLKIDLDWIKKAKEKFNK